jgi:hypothetical protein
MQNILETRDTREYGLYVRTIYGLNIFSANGYIAAPSNDPRIVFLKTLSVQHSSSIHVGSVGLSDIADEPEELFGQPNEHSGYSKVRIGLSEGIFYEAGNNNCFFPYALEQLWTAKDFDDNRNPIQYLIECGALALYVAPYSNIEAMLVLLALPFPLLQMPLHSSQSGWLQEVANIYSLVVVVGHDGMQFSVYSREADNLDMVSAPLHLATSIVESSQWYNQHQQFLQWDDKYEKCLMLPEALAALFDRQFT